MPAEAAAIEEIHTGPKVNQTDPVTRPITDLIGGVKCRDCGHMFDEAEQPPLTCAHCNTTYVVV